MKMKYKIQMVNPLGLWGDMKTSEENGPYKVELFAFKWEAKDEINDMCEGLGDDPSDYRIVREDKIQDVDYYN
jgi:hypothetical protein